MANLLSISNVLSLLQVDRNTDVMGLCIQAEGWRRRGQHEKAIEVAQSAVQLSQNSFDLLGVSSLYLGCARMGSHRSGQRPIGLRDCDRAIRTLSLSPFNFALAQIVRGTFEVWGGTGKCERNALPYIDRAMRILEELIDQARKRNDLENLTLYQEVLNPVCRRIGQLSAALSDMCSDDEVAVSAPPPRPVPTKLSCSTRLEWTAFLTPVPFEFVLSESGSGLPTVIYVMVNQRLCIPFQASPDFDQPSSMQPGLAGYFVMPIAGVTDQYVLGRKCRKPEQTEQFVIVADAFAQEIWVDESRFYPPFQFAHIIGGATVLDVNTAGSGPRIVGVVVAVLAPLPHPAQLTQVKIKHSQLRGVDLPQADLTGAELHDVDLSDAQMEGANLTGAKLRNVDCYQAHLNQANFQEAMLSHNVGLHETHLEQARLCCANLAGADLSRAIACEADLRWANLRGANLSNAHLEGANFDGANLNDADLTGAHLAGTQLKESDLHSTTISDYTHVELEGARIHRVVNADPLPDQADAYGPFVGAILYRVKFIGFDLTRSDFQRANLIEADLRGSQLHDVNLEEANLQHANLRGAKLARAKLNSAHLSGADLRGTILQEADLSNTYLEQADLRHAGLSSANLSRAVLYDAVVDKANFQEANLYGAQLQRVKARGTDFGRARLVQANLQEADLSYAHLVKADLHLADITGADLSHANLRDAHVTPTQLHSAKSLSGATMPDGSIHK